jgi:hypothetical protein
MNAMFENARTATAARAERATAMASGPRRRTRTRLG